MFFFFFKRYCQKKVDSVYLLEGFFFVFEYFYVTLYSINA